MQIYIIGIGQCGSSVVFDVISELKGFVKSGDVKSLPQSGYSEAASNDLLKRMRKDRARTNLRIAPWLNRFRGPSPARKAFILPRIAIIDGNPDNFIKEALSRFAVEDMEGNDKDLRRLVELVSNTKVLGLGQWASGCGNGLVGELVTKANLRPASLQQQLGIDEHGNLNSDNDLLPVTVFLVISSGGGATGSGGGVYLAQTDALLSRAGKRAAAGPNNAIVANAVVLPSLQASLDNRKYVLNAGRALARHGNMITETKDGDSAPGTPSSIILFSNPHNEGDSRALQRLNNYLAEFAIRVANFTCPGSVARIARDVGIRELMFLRGKTCVLAMSHLAEELWDDETLESALVQRAFANLYESSTDKPYGLSVESVDAEHNTASVTATATSAMVVVGVPPTFQRSLSTAGIGDFLRKYSGSELRSGVGSFAYGSAKNLELTVILRYRSMRACPLAMHFVRQYVGKAWQVDADELSEIEYIRSRASQAEEDDEYTETFEAFAADLDELGRSMNFDTQIVHLSAPRGGAGQQGR